MRLPQTDEVQHNSICYTFASCQVRNGLTRLSNATEAHKMLLGHLVFVAQLVAKQEKLEAGFRVCINDGPDGEATA